MGCFRLKMGYFEIMWGSHKTKMVSSRKKKVGGGGGGGQFKIERLLSRLKKKRVTSKYF